MSLRQDNSIKLNMFYVVFDLVDEIITVKYSIQTLEIVCTLGNV